VFHRANDNRASIVGQDGLVYDHAVAHVVEHQQVRMNQIIIELDLLLAQLVVVRVHLVDQLPVEVHQLLQLLPQQSPHVLLLALPLILISLALALALQIAVDSKIRVNLQYGVRFFASHTAIFAPTYLTDVWTPPRISILYAVNNVILVDKDETVKTEFLLA
jgi:hypothetical protein